jgi:predicted transposase YbfD/YdcC
VYRKVIVKEKTSIETAFFISSLPPNTPAKIFNEGVRLHWSIESFHWIKDVTFKEDASKVSIKNAPENYSLLRNMAINIFRKNGFHKIQSITEKCANNVSFMMHIF